MRAIKWRAWDKEDKEMLYDPMVNIAVDTTVNDIFQDESFVWMQFTGLYDTSGQEIYERDIIRIENARISGCTDHGIPGDFDYLYEDYTTAIEFENGVFCLREPNSDTYVSLIYLHHARSKKMEEIEIIGNIYEHPHLVNYEDIQ